MLGGAVLLAALGCGGGSGDGGGNKTYKGDGYSFSYPGDWAEQSADVSTGRLDVLVAPPEGGRNAVGLTVLPNAVAKPITNANIEKAVVALRPAVVALMLREGGVLKDEPAPVTNLNLPGIRFESESKGLETKVHQRSTWLFDRTTAYTISCTYVASGADETQKACDLVLKSFKTSD